MKALSTYLQERFPLLISSILAISTSALLIGVITQPITPGSAAALVGTVSLAFLAFMLRMRITDEFKDLAHDSANYPNRPVQRGAITRTQLLRVGLVATILEFAAVIASCLLLSDVSAAIWYSIVVAFSVLTNFEFFAKKYLDAHFNIYFVTHQSIFFVYPIWLCVASQVSFDWTQIAGLGAFVVSMANMEVVRKYEIRLSPDGEIVRDTYLAVWGETAFWLMGALGLIGGSLILVATGTPLAVMVAAISLVLMISFKRNHEAVRAIVAVGFMAQCLAALLT